MSQPIPPTDPPSGLIETPLRRLVLPEYDPVWAWHRRVSQTLMDLVSWLPGPRLASLGRRRAIRDARKHARRLTDWAQLAALADGAVVSLTGRARAQRTFPLRVDDRTVFALALSLQVRTMHTPESEAFEPMGRQAVTGARYRATLTERQRISLLWRDDDALLEAGYDFDVINDDQQSLPVAVEDARILAAPGLPVETLTGARALLDQIALPASALAKDQRAFLLRDDQPVEIIGFKQTLVRPTGHRLERERRIEATVAGTRHQPLLLICRA